jgi:ABC-type Fe3+ transport system substrate-binding protein
MVAAKRCIGRVARGVSLALVTGTLAACMQDQGSVTLIVRTDLPEVVRDYVKETFEAVHQDTDVRFTIASTKTTLVELQAIELQGGPPFDVWWGAHASGLQAASDEGRLMTYQPRWLGRSAAVDLQYDGEWHPLLLTPYVIAFSRGDLELARAPSDWIDLRHFQWSDDIEILDPSRSEAGEWFLISMLQQAASTGDLESGFDWLSTIDRYVESYATNTSDALQALREKRSRLAIVPRADVELARSKNSPWLYYRLPESGTPVLVRGVALMNGTKEAGAAQAFLDHLGSIDVRTETKLRTRWQPVFGTVDSSRIPVGFELQEPWAPFAIPFDTIQGKREGWLDRWEQEIRAR